MTEQEKQVLAGLCRIEIKRWKAAAESNPNMRYMVELMEVALASLTAESGCIKCSDSLHENKPGTWSEEVAAVSDIGGLFKGSHYPRHRRNNG